jgi:hypothetical protein
MPCGHSQLPANFLEAGARAVTSFRVFSRVFLPDLIFTMASGLWVAGLGVLIDPPESCTGLWGCVVGDHEEHGEHGRPCWLQAGPLSVGLVSRLSPWVPL